ncbi:YlbE-like family protein [Salipaludibacillus sp. LMS25]|uniref:YlbE-like family protein n=1 Tax=Salipaludibacillus sp. LMS25 TaxID=2924031 RepID=UPI0020D06401|nr:YlbE-like family protein [Salipaludibacillus sp. LMS25]UTR15210.1 YlbE-like family protein [Salipaludibacillus sp. LMS25]
MRKDVLDKIKLDPQLHHYLRLNPIWYRRLGRQPESLHDMRKQAKVFYGKTFPQRVDQINKNMQMAMMMIDMMKQVQDQ